MTPIPMDPAEIEAVTRAIEHRLDSMLDIPEALGERGTLYLLLHKLEGAGRETCRCGRHAPSGQCSSCAEGGR